MGPPRPRFRKAGENWDARGLCSSALKQPRRTHSRNVKIFRGEISIVSACKVLSSRNLGQPQFSVTCGRQKTWRKRVGVEPTIAAERRRSPVLKTGRITGPRALPESSPRSPLRLSESQKNQPRITAILARIRGPFLINRIQNGRPSRRLPGLRHDAQIRLGRLPAFGVLELRFLVGHCRQDDHIAALRPVHRRCDFVASGELHGVEDAH
jgi:hypothetical protein